MDVRTQKSNDQASAGGDREAYLVGWDVSVKREALFRNGRPFEADPRRHASYLKGFHDCDAYLSV
jgi:hypothetical protein